MAFTPASDIVSAIFRSPDFDPILPPVLSCLTIVELIFIQTVNHRLYHHCATAKRAHIKRLHFGQFWSRLGTSNMDTAPLIQLIHGFGAVRELVVAYCHFITGDLLLTMIKSIPNSDRIERLNCFYCHLLTDDHIDSIVQLLPNLTEINVGRCLQLTDKCMRSLATLTHLRQLSIIHNPHITEETLMIFDDPTKFISLTQWNVVNVTKYKPAEIEELKISRPNLKIIGPVEVFAPIDRNGKKQQRKDEPNYEQN